MRRRAFVALLGGAAAKAGSELIRVNVSTGGDLDRAFDELKGRDAS